MTSWNKSPATRRGRATMWWSRPRGGWIKRWKEEIGRKYIDNLHKLKYIHIYILSTNQARHYFFQICPCSSNICQIRIDFTNFVINQPFTGSLNVLLNFLCFLSFLPPNIINNDNIDGCPRMRLLLLEPALSFINWEEKKRKISLLPYQ